MPGICGIISPANGRFDTALPERLKLVNRLNGIRDHIDLYHSRNCLLVNFYSDPSYSRAGRAAFARCDEKILMLEGEVLNIDDLRRGLNMVNQSETDTLLQLFLRKGIGFLDHLNGEFTIVIYDIHSHKLTICMDHIASHPMYYMQTKEGLVFAAEKKLLMVLTQQRFDINPVGLLQFMSHIHNVGDITFIKDLYRMEPGQRLTSTGHEYDVRSVDFLSLDSPPQTNSNEILEEWSDELRKATARRVKDDRSILMSLSAGLDSRAIACSIDRDYRPLYARTWGTPDSTEVQYASQIAERLRFNHILEDPRHTRYSDALHAIVWRTEGESPCTNAVSIFGHSRVMKTCDYVAGGWLGDASSGAHLRPFMFLPKTRRTFIDKVFDWYVVYPPAQLKTVFRTDFLEANLEGLRAEFHRSFERFSTCDNTKAYEFWDVFNRQTRMTTSSMPVDTHLFGMIRPFYDRNYLNFVMSLPATWRIGQSYYKTLINRIGPEIRSIPDSNTDLTLKSEAWRNLTGYFFARRHNALRKIAKKFGRDYQNKRIIPAQVKSEAIRNDLNMRSTLEWYLDSEYFDDGIFDREAIENMLAMYYSKSLGHSDLIVRLATSLVALRYFVYQRPSSCPEGANPLEVPLR